MAKDATRHSGNIVSINEDTDVTTRPIPKPTAPTKISTPSEPAAQPTSNQSSSKDGKA